MNTVFDIRDFGAVGDGVTDCTKAIQKALDLAADCMGKVIVPPGNYLTGKLNMHGDCVRLEGSSSWSFRKYGASILTLNADDVDCMIDITGAFGCTISGVSMDGRRLGKGIHGIKLYWDKYNGGGSEDTPTVEDCRIGGFTGNGIHFEHVWCFSVRHSMICSNLGAGLYIDGWDAFIIDNWFTGNVNGGIMGKLVASITCTGNRVEWNRRGGFILPCGDSYNITGNFFDRSFGPALQLGTKDTSVDMVTVTGNIFRRSGAYEEGKEFDNEDMCSHVIMENCSGTVVTGNTVRAGVNDGGVGVLTPYYSFIISDCKNCIVKDNTLNNGAIRENMVLRGDNSTCIIDENIGSLATK
ncbi:MAG: hypothetical protein IJF54_07200 [Clostridia bacterium]|nr:hypothetical protein [Clostridia bacterium]